MRTEVRTPKVSTDIYSRDIILKAMINPLPIAKSLDMLQTWAQSHAPGVSFRPPADSAAIANFIDKSSLTIPEELHQLLLRADGETRKSAGLIGNWRLMPIAEIQAAWGLLTKLAEKGAFTDHSPNPSPYIRHMWWHAAWIPIVSSDAGDYFCLDTDPPESQRFGQVLLYLQDRPERFLIAGSLRAWFDRIVQDLHEGIYTYDCEKGFNIEAFMWSALEGKHLFEEIKGTLIVEKDHGNEDTP